MRKFRGVLKKSWDSSLPAVSAESLSTQFPGVSPDTLRPLVKPLKDSLRNYIEDHVEATMENMELASKLSQLDAYVEQHPLLSAEGNIRCPAVPAVLPSVLHRRIRVQRKQAARDQLQAYLQQLNFEEVARNNELAILSDDLEKHYSRMSKTCEVFPHNMVPLVQ
jgi:hypothetical protein